MSKLTQLEHIRSQGLPTPAFTGLRYEAFRAGGVPALRLRFPVAVRSSYSAEDSSSHSFAGYFRTRLHVDKAGLPAAIAEVFASYPDPQGQEVIIQEMVEAEYSGVLFGFRGAIWKTELAEGAGEQLVSGKVQPETLLLPHFSRADTLLTPLLGRWRPFDAGHKLRPLLRPLVLLSHACGRLLEASADEAPLGLDIEYSIAKGRLYLLQARPITTPGEAEEVLTSANHKEILPNKPSRMMTAIISSCSQHLFSYYQRLDPALPDRNFIEVSEGMPWINLSALLDMMVSWGLPTSLVCDSVGAEDVYRVKFRPWQSLRKVSVFVRVLREYVTVGSRTRRWVRHSYRSLLTEIEGRRILWRNEPDIAFTNWFTQMQMTYVGLVSLMQALTGAMSGPVKLLAKLGWLQSLMNKSESTLYLEAYRQMTAGLTGRQDFLQNYGHRGFYESDIGQKRFDEFTEAEWMPLMAAAGPVPQEGPAEQAISRMMLFLTQPFLRMIRTREWLRNHAMRFFAMLRMEIKDQTESRVSRSTDFAAFEPEDLRQALTGELPAAQLAATAYPIQSGWNADTFLRTRNDRRTPVSVLASARFRQDPSTRGLGIYPGKVSGQIWKVAEAGTDVQKPDFERVILLTESLDPGWIPYFVQVQGVLAYVGGILSHASIILRESHIPSVTQLPRSHDFETGDWVKMDGRSGEVVLIKKYSD